MTREQVIEVSERLSVFQDHSGVGQRMDFPSVGEYGLSCRKEAELGAVRGRYS